MAKISQKTIKSLQEDYEFHISEAKKHSELSAEFSASAEDIKKIIESFKGEKRLDRSTSDFPFEGSLLEKLQYIEAIEGRFWKLDDMKQQLIEKDKKSKDSMEYLSQRVQQLIREEKAASVRFNGSRI